MDRKRHDRQETRAKRLLQAVHGIRADLATAPPPPAAPGARPATSNQAERPHPSIRFSKETSALRQHVAEVQASRGAVAPTLFRIHLPPADTDATGRPWPLETLRERVEQARQVPNVRAEPAPEHMAPSDETVRIEPRGSGGPQLGSAADVGRLVRERRRQAGMSQGELALTAHTGRRFISELEAGKPTVELERVLTILRALEIRLLAEPRSHER